MFYENFSELQMSISTDTKDAFVYIVGCLSQGFVYEDSLCSYKKFADFRKDINHGSLKVHGDTAFMWIIYSYILFQEMVNNTC